MLPAKLDYGVRTVPIPGEEVVADLCLVKQFGESWLLAVIDGLGHGQEALQASEIAQEVIERFDEEPHLATILSICDLAMKHTRGAVIGLALIDYRQRRLTWSGVGNVEGRVVWRGDNQRLQQSTLMSTPGIVGFNLPKLRQQVYDLRPGSLIILFTDGVNGSWAFPENRWLFEMGTEALATRLMKSYATETDDSLVAVARY